MSDPTVTPPAATATPPATPAVDPNASTPAPAQTPAPAADPAAPAKNPDGSPIPVSQSEKTPETPAAKPPVTDKFELKAPENSLLDAAAIEKIASFAKEKGLSQEQAQSIVDRENQSLKGYQEGLKATMEQNKTKWLEASMADKEIGGDKFVENSELSKRAVDRFGSDALKKEFNEHGFGNHPEMIRAWAKVGRAMAEDKIVIPPVQTPPKKAPESVLYGQSEEQKDKQ